MSDRAPASSRYVRLLITCGFACLALSLGSGLLAALYYLPRLAATMHVRGLSLIQLRPLHTTFASAWIYLAAIGCVYHYLFATMGEPSAAERRRFKLQMICWGLAGLGILTTVAAGLTSGREYLGFHPAFSLLILAGWGLFAWTFLARVASGFWARPVYVYMWTTGILLFVYTFAEGHAWLIPAVRDHPVADLQIQWKSAGTLVASFNLLVYGTLMYVGERMSGCTKYAQSRLGFALLGVGLLNSFTNYAHHTYHLPQSHLIKWVAFVVSMLEIIILVRVLQDVVGSLRARRGGEPTMRGAIRLIGLSKTWTLCLLVLAILISIPPINALIHGTHVVMAHAMGSMLGIDSYILLGAIAWILVSDAALAGPLLERINGAFGSRTITVLNLAMAAVVLWLLASGATRGFYENYAGQPPPAWIGHTPVVLASVGSLLALSLLTLMARWLPLLLGRPAATAEARP